MVPIIDDSLSF